MFIKYNYSYIINDFFYSMMWQILLLFIGFCSALSPTTYLTPADKEHLKIILDSAWSLTDLSQVFYAVGGYQHLGLGVPDHQVK